MSGIEDDSFLNKDAFKDSLDIWRSKNCTLSTKHYKCQPCKKLQNILRQRQARSAKGEIYIRSASNLRDQRKIAALKKKLGRERRIKYHAKFRIQMLKDALDKSHKDLAAIESTDFESKCTELNICETQKMAMREIISSAKKNGTGRRYSENWIMLCMLMNIRSPTYYEFLRRHSVLPLPCKTTIRSYFSLIDTKCGFDDKFAELLKKHYAVKSESKRHGLLVFDEINLRKDISVHSTTLTYAGLVDFGQEGPKPTDIANQATHGLVILFQPLADTYTQPIAVFASKNPVKGDELAKLAVKAIIYAESCGAKIHGIISDGAKTNKRMATLLDIRSTIVDTKNWFTHPIDENRQVFMFSDIPHVVKNIRNRLYNNKRLKVSCMRQIKNVIFTLLILKCKLTRFYYMVIKPHYIKISHFI